MVVRVVAGAVANVSRGAVMEFRNAHQLSLELVGEKLAMNENESEG